MANGMIALKSQQTREKRATIAGAAVAVYSITWSFCTVYIGVSNGARNSGNFPFGRMHQLLAAAAAAALTSSTRAGDGPVVITRREAGNCGNCRRLEES